MRYERSAPAVLPRPLEGSAEALSRRRGARRRLLVAAMFVAGGVVAGVVVAASPPGGSRSPVSAAEQATLRSRFLSVNNLTESLGAPAPPELAFASGSWILRGVALAGAGGAHPHLTVPERPWISAGRYVGLSAAEAARTVQLERAGVASVASGSLRAQLDGELDQLVRGETGNSRQIASPGGARVEQWESLTANGGAARVEAILAIWEQRDAVVRAASGALRLEATVFVGQVNAVATLARHHGRWLVTSLAQAPYPQPT